MKNIPAWQYDEFKHVGVDYADQAEAERYDARHADFRGDLAAEADRLLDSLGIAPGQVLIDMGCGTGNMAIRAALRGVHVYAVDVSPAMLAVAERKARVAGIDAINFCQGGFLSYEHEEEPADVVTSSVALHHLPDFWKLIGLRRIAALLKDRGRLYLMDTVFSFEIGEYQPFFDNLIAQFAAQVAHMGGDVTRHIRDEYTTLDWIMEGLLARAGFDIEQAVYPDGFFARYSCRKAER